MPVRAHVQPDTIIVGAGIAGLACARRLYGAGVPFLILTEDVGGRIRRSQDGAINLGAYYVRADYDHVNRFVDRGRRIDRLDVRRHDERGSYHFLSSAMFAHPAQSVRFLRLLRRFRTHYEAFKRNCLTQSQANALRSDSFLWHLYRLPASSLLRRLEMEDVARSHVGPALYGTAFRPLHRLTAFTVLLGSLPALVPIYEFSFRIDVLAGDFFDAIRFGSVVSVSRVGDGYRLVTRGHGEFVAANVVLATPIAVSRGLVGLSDVKRGVDVHMFEVRGRLQRSVRSGDLHLFRENDAIHAIACHPNDLFLVCSQLDRPRLDQIFDEWRVVERRYWNPAFSIEGTSLLECEQGPGLFLVGDHNVCGLEDAYLTGHYAAGRIIEQASHGLMSSAAHLHRNAAWS